MNISADVVGRAGRAGSGEVLPKILGAEVDAAQGRVKSEPANRHAGLYPRSGRVDAQGQFTIVRQATRAVYPDPYLVTHSLGDWTARLDTLEV